MKTFKVIREVSGRWTEVCEVVAETAEDAKEESYDKDFKKVYFKDYDSETYVEEVKKVENVSK